MEGMKRENNYKKIDEVKIKGGQELSKQETCSQLTVFKSVQRLKNGRAQYFITQSNNDNLNVSSLNDMIKHLNT